MSESGRRRKRTRDCATGKMRFKDHAEAVDFLHHAANARALAEQDGVSTTHEAVRAYGCGMCKGFHVTSQARLSA